MSGLIGAPSADRLRFAPAGKTGLMSSVAAAWGTQEVADYFGCSKSWVYDASAAGRLPSLAISGMLRFDPEAIRRLAKGGRDGSVLKFRGKR
jgi:hypothetical protein